MDGTVAQSRPVGQVLHFPGENLLGLPMLLSETQAAIAAPTELRVGGHSTEPSPIVTDSIVLAGEEAVRETPVFTTLCKASWRHRPGEATGRSV